MTDSKKLLIASLAMGTMYMPDVIHGNIYFTPAYYPKHTKRKVYMNSKSTFNKNK